MNSRGPCYSRVRCDSLRIYIHPRLVIQIASMSSPEVLRSFEVASEPRMHMLLAHITLGEPTAINLHYLSWAEAYEWRPKR